MLIEVTHGKSFDLIILSMHPFDLLRKNATHMNTNGRNNNNNLFLEVRGVQQEGLSTWPLSRYTPCWDGSQGAGRSGGD